MIYFYLPSTRESLKYPNKLLLASISGAQWSSAQLHNGRLACDVRRRGTARPIHVLHTQRNTRIHPRIVYILHSDVTTPPTNHRPDPFKPNSWREIRDVATSRESRSERECPTRWRSCLSYFDKKFNVHKKIFHYLACILSYESFWNFEFKSLGK